MHGIVYAKAMDVKKFSKCNKFVSTFCLFLIRNILQVRQSVRSNTYLIKFSKTSLPLDIAWDETKIERQQMLKLCKGRLVSLQAPSPWKAVLFAKYLGIVIDDKLSWHTYIDSLIK